MQLICAWCGKDLSADCSEQQTERPISHGICIPCARNLFNDMLEPMQNFLDSFTVPILVLDANNNVLAAGREAIRRSGIKPEEIKGLKSGNVLGCVFSIKEGGCGYTIHCRGCVMLQAIKHTHETGLPRIRVPAYPDFHWLGKSPRVLYHISSEKIGDSVVLILEESKLEK